MTTAQPEIGYGLIGCGWVGSAHAWGVTASSGETARLIATSDVDLAAAEQMADRFGAQGAYQDYRELLRRDDIQAVSVCVPDFLHRQVVIDAAQAGKHVLCEKPLAMSVAEADDMIEACATNGVEFGMIMNHRYAPDNIRAKDALAKGAVGSQLIGSVVHSSGLTGPLGTSPWRGITNRAAGGVVSTQAIHFLDLILWFMGPVRSIKAMTDTLHWDIQDHEDTAVLALRLESGALATLTTTNGSPIMDDFTGTRVEVHGTRGWLALEGDVFRHAEFAEDFEVSPIHLPDVPSGAGEIIFGLGHVYEVMDFIHSIRTGTEAPVPARDGRHLMAVIEAAYKSAAEGDEVELSKKAVGYTQPSPPDSLLSVETHRLGATLSPEPSPQVQ